MKKLSFEQMECIEGGEMVKCDDVIFILNYLGFINPAKAQAVRDLIEGGGFQGAR